MTKAPLLPVSDALARILAPARPLGMELVPLSQAADRTLAEDVIARRTQPPFDASAMDGYAVRAEDIATVPARLDVVGESAAGTAFAGTVQPGQAARIFTGAPVPQGADTVVLQETTRRDGINISVEQSEPLGRHIRKAGLDFAQGQALLQKGLRLNANRVALAAAMNHPALPCTRRPRVAILATGSELVAPGAEPGPDQIVASNSFAVAIMAEKAGAEVFDLGIVADDLALLRAAIAKARDAKADILVTLGGASVGDHDLVQQALHAEGMTLDFWKLALRPGKPLMHGMLGGLHVLGLPGNPVSAIVCSKLFVVPLIRALSGDPDAADDHSEPARLAVPVKANDFRQDYLRATLTERADDLPRVTPHGLQDSSMLRVLAEAQCLLIRVPHAAAADAGDLCRIIRL
ncbi:molybdopterin molybdotransferase MoeA [Methylovirgula sp. 4M-Z18]|uniref:molybdopterin molybdotransferase MoeA n=1 Tax=Methylovirgula sp. 4M-Z18 TaxID=2293567 RepID=UPI000E2FC4A4|nr:gephyrin-like molybdotransferase Glp [Methylovirgula sp. 4M-Z18]RFB81466.1 molybdopterin molybdenumtransferase MoeA [Methylovirgula sp. 4M-Z18]